MYSGDVSRCGTSEEEVKVAMEGRGECRIWLQSGRAGTSINTSIMAPCNPREPLEPNYDHTTNATPEY